MIGRIKGVLVYKNAPEVIIDVNGVGYEVQTSLTSFCQLPELEHMTCLYTQLIVREDAHTLFGFIDLAERTLFRALIKVNSVGPKLALTILSSTSPDELRQTIVLQDSVRLSKIPGIGKKTAERLIIELRDKMAQDISLGSHPLTDPKTTAILAPVLAHAPSQEATSALTNLGYSLAEASRAISLIAEVDALSCEAIIKAALKSLAK
jgi:Holliday junction DNA helicase RuvA